MFTHSQPVNSLSTHSGLTENHHERSHPEYNHAPSSEPAWVTPCGSYSGSRVTMIFCPPTFPRIASHPVHRRIGGSLRSPSIVSRIVMFCYLTLHLVVPRIIEPISHGLRGTLFVTSRLNFDFQPHRIAHASSTSRYECHVSIEYFRSDSVPPSRHVPGSPQPTMLSFSITTKREHPLLWFLSRVLNAGLFSLCWFANSILPQLSLLVKRKR